MVARAASVRQAQPAVATLQSRGASSSGKCDALGRDTVFTFFRIRVRDLDQGCAGRVYRDQAVD
jgi:hypothetical protein